MFRHLFNFFVYKVVILLLPSFGFADTAHIARSMKDIGPNLSEQEYVSVQSARIAYINYDLLANDFDYLKKQPHETISLWKSRLDAWFLKRTRFLRWQQVLKFNSVMKYKKLEDLQPNYDESVEEWHFRLKKYTQEHSQEFYNRMNALGEAVNTRLDVDWTQTKRVFIPPNYNRAHLIPVSGGFLDIKGSGTSSPSHSRKQNGLLPLPEALREVIMEKAVSKILDHSGIGLHTVGTYGVIDWGFNVIFEDGQQLPAGQVVRQATKRDDSNNSQLEASIQVMVERVLRAYGLTSSGDTLASVLAGRAKHLNNKPGINVQGNLVSDIIDFGHITHFNSDDFKDLELVPLGKVSNRNLGKQVEQEARLIPLNGIKELIVPEIFHQNSAETNPINDRVYIYSRDLGWSLQRNFNRDHVTQHLANFLGPLEEKLAKAKNNWFRSPLMCQHFYQ